jgi:glycosyltransferase involved in cell wall biosynthesis
MERLFFSIIIPVYNRDSLIRKTIESCLNQTYKDFEIIVVNDGSTDNTEEVVKLIQSDKILYFKKENGERAAARNFGIAKSSGNYVTFVDSDDLLYPTYLSNASETICKSEAPFVHLAYEVKDNFGTVLTKKNFIKSHTYDFLVRGNPLSCLGVFIKRENLAQFRFNEDRELSMVEDWELWLRLVANFRIVADNRISAAMIYHKKRSLNGMDISKLAKAKEMAIKYAFEDKAVQHIYGNHKGEMVAFSESYVALNFALTGNKKSALNYLRKSFTHYPGVIFSKRFLVILKYLLV